jgi:hypothetical protein
VGVNPDDAPGSADWARLVPIVATAAASIHVFRQAQLIWEIEM